MSQYTNCIMTEAARASENFVSQYTDCIVTERQARQGLCHNTLKCIVTREQEVDGHCITIHLGVL